MKHEGDGQGCMFVVGLLCFGAAFYVLVMSIGSSSAEGFPFLCAFILAGVIVLGIADVRSRLGRIEKHLGLDQDDDEEVTEDSNIRVDHSSEVQ